MSSELEVLITEFEAKKTDEKARLEALRQSFAELEARILKLEQDQAERETKKNRKFQTKCIQIAKEILNEEPMIEYRPPFLNGLELDAFFQKYRIALEVQEAQHRLHSTSWYKDVKKLEDIVNRDRQKRCMCQDNGISLLEVWYDEKPEIVIPERIRKIKDGSYSKEMSLPREFSEETKNLLAVWRDIILEKHKDDDDEIFCSDPLLIIEYHQPGTPGYTPNPFPNVTHPPQSNSVFAFNRMQTMDDAVARLLRSYSNLVSGRPDPVVGQVYVVEFRRANTYEVSERTSVFD
ncbi:13400_t:CDS:2 [Cetraspora pellucida]|uniref:13400_t:CDS:1 n=1 Tax=Cetraspora pellucida TaxID=1433469 RepID=A0A9N9FE10_9GLOM|nr:13400_t:CDS:2 [Cetraspora pellucida]